MASLVDTAVDTYRDYETAGLPVSGAHEPEKPEIRALLTSIITAISALGLTGALAKVKQTRALLNADLVAAADAIGLVWGDATAANNDFYVKIGGSGTGSWTKLNLIIPAALADQIAELAAAYADLPEQLEAAANAATASAASAVAAAASASSAASDKNAVAAQVVIATAQANAAQAAADEIAGLAETLGPTKFYDSHAAATTDIAAIGANDVVEVMTDETRQNHRTRYRKVSGALSFRLDLTLTPPPERYGASTSGTALNNRDAFNTMLAALAPAETDFDLGGKTYDLSTLPTVPFGARYRNGKVIVPSGISSYKYQLNTYAHDFGYFCFREHMDAFWLACTANTQQRILLFGDSTVETSGAYPVKPEGLVKLALRDCGINSITDVENHGLSGTSWSDLPALAELAADVKLIAIKYGINDAAKSNNLVTMAADMRSKLTAIRAATDGDYPELSILLIGPNATWRPQYDQDPKWYEQVRTLYLQVAREFGCAYFDLYAYEQDASRAPGFTQDSFDGGQGLHPTPVKVYDFWRQVWATDILQGGFRNIQRSVNFHNVDRDTEIANPSAVPESYHMGYTIYSVLKVEGWPADGTLYVVRDTEEQVTQIIHTLDIKPRLITRTGGITSGVWTQWDGVPIEAAPGDFRNSWVNAGGSYMGVCYWVDNGDIVIQGMIDSGTTGTDIACLQLPTTHFPAAPMKFGCYAQVGTASVLLGTDGMIKLTCSDNTLIGLDIRIRALGTPVA